MRISWEKEGDSGRRRETRTGNLYVKRIFPALYIKLKMIKMLSILFKMYNETHYYV